MSMTDPIADFLTRIRNAIHAAHETVEIPASTLKAELARILTEQGYIDSWSVGPAPDGAAGQVLEIHLKYTEDRRSAISGLRRVSRPGRRTYVQAGSHPQGTGRHGHIDRLDLPRRHDRPRRARRWRRRRGSGPGLVGAAGTRSCPESEDNPFPCRPA